MNERDGVELREVAADGTISKCGLLPELYGRFEVADGEGDRLAEVPVRRVPTSPARA
jgi:hypothetical protein